MHEGGGGKGQMHFPSLPQIGVTLDEQVQLGLLEHQPYGFLEHGIIGVH